MNDIESKRRARRAAMPIVAGFVEQLEAHELQPVVIFASEGGITFGKRQQYREVFEIPQGYRMPTEQPKKRS